MQTVKTIFVFLLFGFAVWLYWERSSSRPSGEDRSAAKAVASSAVARAKTAPPTAAPNSDTGTPTVAQEVERPRLAIIPFWNYSGAAYENLPGDLSIGQCVARALAASTSRLAAHKELEILLQEDVARAFEKDLSPKDRQAWEDLRAARNLDGARPLLESLIRGLRAKTLVFGTFEKLGGGDPYEGAVRVEFLVLNKPRDAADLEVATSEFRGAIPGSMVKLCESLAQDVFWDGKEMTTLWRRGKLHLKSWEEKLDQLPYKVEADRFQVALEALKGELIPTSRCWMTQEDMKKASLATDQLLIIERKNPRTHNLRAMVELCGDNRPAARQELKVALEIDPNYPEAQYNLGFLALDRWWEGKYPPDLDEAYAALTQAIRARRDFPEAYALRGVVNVEHGNLAEAESDLNNAYQTNQKLSMIYLGRALLAMRKQGNDATARSELSTALQYEPTNALVQKLRGDLSAKRGYTTEAIEAYRAAAAAKPLYFEARIALVDLLSQSRSPTEAENECKAMIALNPKHSVPHYKLGKLCEQRRDFTCAEQEYAEVAKLEPAWPAIQDDLNRARQGRSGYQRTPQYEQFRRSLDKAQSGSRPGSRASPTPTPTAAW